MAESMIEKVRRFAGADPDVPDTELEMFCAAAVEWYKSAGVRKWPNWDLWVFWVCNLAAWMYDNRGNADPGAAIPVYIVSSVHQLRSGPEDDPEEDPDDAESGSGEESGSGAGADPGEGDPDDDAENGTETDGNGTGGSDPEGSEPDGTGTDGAGGEG